MCFKPCVHFVGFKDDAYNRAIQVFGKPDFVHRSLDLRALSDIAPGDTVVFARDKDWNRLVASYQVPVAPCDPWYPYSPYSFNDSEQF